MRKSSSFSVMSIVVLSLLTSCADQGGPITKQGAGTVLGAVAGTIVGANVGKGTGRTVAIAVGALGGAALGNSMGASLDKADRQYVSQASQRTFETMPSGQTTTWRNPDSGNHGAITPTRTFQKNDRYCREFTQTIVVGGKKQEGYGTACRQPDGTWEIIN